MKAQILGMVVVCLSGVAGGCFAFPLRLRKVFTEENTLFGAYALAIVAIPLVVASLVFPFWPRVFAAAPWKQLLLPLACGVGWGFGAMAYARGVSRIGLGLAVSTVMSLTIAIGAIIPLLARWTAASVALRASILTGVGICVVGVALFGVAGRLRESSGTRTDRRAFITGFLWCVASGVLSPLANIGFDAGAPFVAKAVELGGDPNLSAMLGFIPLWAGCFLTLLVVLGGRMLRTGSWKNYVAPGARGDLLRTGAMGGLHFLSQTPYGIGAFLLGAFGTSIGWATTLAAQLVTATGLGALMGEWREASRAARTLLIAGLLVVLAAVGVLAYAATREAP